MVSAVAIVPTIVPGTNRYTVKYLLSEQRQSLSRSQEHRALVCQFWLFDYEAPDLTPAEGRW